MFINSSFIAEPNFLILPVIWNFKTLAGLKYFFNEIIRSIIECSRNNMYWTSGKSLNCQEGKEQSLKGKYEGYFKNGRKTGKGKF